MVQSLTNKFSDRYGYYFTGHNSDWLAVENELNAVERLDAMARVRDEMVNEPFEKVDLKFGVHGGVQSGQLEASSSPGDGVDTAAAKSMPANLRHRRLSTALPDGGCEITWPKPANGVQTAYAASYPGETLSFGPFFSSLCFPVSFIKNTELPRLFLVGCGARMSWNLVRFYCFPLLMFISPFFPSDTYPLIILGYECAD